MQVTVLRLISSGVNEAASEAGVEFDWDSMAGTPEIDKDVCICVDDEVGSAVGRELCEALRTINDMAVEGKAEVVTIEDGVATFEPMLDDDEEPLSGPQLSVETPASRLMPMENGYLRWWPSKEVSFDFKTYTFDVIGAPA